MKLFIILLTILVPILSIGQSRDSLFSSAGLNTEAITNNGKDLLDTDSLEKEYQVVSKNIWKNIIQLSPQKVAKNQIRSLNENLNSLYNNNGRTLKSSFLKLSFAEITNSFNSAPLVLVDSTIQSIQNNLQGNFSFSVNNYGFSGYVFYKRTISGPLPDYLDFHVGFNGKTPVRLQPTNVSKERVLQALKLNGFDSSINTIKSELAKLNTFTSANHLKNKALAAKEIISNYNVDKSYKFIDSSTLVGAKEFMKFYSAVEDNINAITKLKDSVSMFRNELFSKIKHSLNQQEVLKQLDVKGLKEVLSDSVRAVSKKGSPNLGLSRLSKLSFGRILPYQSELTLKNNSLKGIDVGYEINKFSFSTSAGFIDFRMNNLIVKRKLETPLPYAVVAYVGYKPFSPFTIGLRYFTGRKDNYGNGIRKTIVQGLSSELVYRSKGKMAAIEVAKGFNQALNNSDSLAKKPFLEFSDYNNMAVSIKSSLYNRSTRTNISASFSFLGKFYNAFNSFTTNTQTKQYDVKLSQDLLRGTIRLSSWIRNTEFTPSINGIILQNNVTLKSFSATLYKPHLPIVSIGFNPVKQAFLTDSTLQVLIYHAASLFASYNYLLGERKAAVLLVVNKLGNKEASGIAPNSLSNSLNFILDHTIDFDDYISLFSLSYTKSPNFLFVTVKGGVQLNPMKKISFNTAFTVNHFNRINKPGGNVGIKMKIKERGDFGLDYNLSYLPSLSGVSLSDYNYGSLYFRYNLIH